MTMDGKERLTAIIGIRVYPSWKRQMMEEAIERGRTLSEYVYELIEAGWDKVVNGDVKQKDESVKQGEQKPLV